MISFDPFGVSTEPAVTKADLTKTVSVTNKSWLTDWHTRLQSSILSDPDKFFDVVFECRSDEEPSEMKESSPIIKGIDEEEDDLECDQINTAWVKGCRLFFALQSEVFEAMFFRDSGMVMASMQRRKSLMKPGQSLEVIRVPDCTVRGFTVLRDYCIGTEISLSLDNVIDTLSVANKYQVRGLLDLCEQWLIDYGMHQLSDLGLLLKRMHKLGLIELCLDSPRLGPAINRHLCSMFLSADSVVHLPFVLIQSILASDLLAGVSEDSIWEQCLLWAEYTAADQLKCCDSRTLFDDSSHQKTTSVYDGGFEHKIDDDECKKDSRIQKKDDDDGSDDDDCLDQAALLRLCAPFIRFPNMTALYFSQKVCNTGVLSDSEQLSILRHISGDHSVKVEYRTDPRSVNMESVFGDAHWDGLFDSLSVVKHETEVKEESKEEETSDPFTDDLTTLDDIITMPPMMPIPDPIFPFVESNPFDLLTDSNHQNPTAANDDLDDFFADSNHTPAVGNDDWNGFE